MKFFLLSLFISFPVFGKGLEPYLKICMFYTDEMMIDCPQGSYIRSDLISDPKLEPFFQLAVKMENLDQYKEKKLKKMKFLDPRLEKCTYYTDKMIIDCPQGTYVRSDLVKDPKIVQFIQQKKHYDDTSDHKESSTNKN